MKRIFLLLPLIFLLTILTACSAGDATEESRFNSNDIFNIVTDSETGCKYLTRTDHYVGGITALLKSDGTPECPDVE